MLFRPQTSKTVDGASQRAITGAFLAEGSTRPTIAQAAAAAGVCPAYVRAVIGATELERSALQHGWLTVSALHNRARRKCPTRAARLRAIKKYGAYELLTEIDLMTAPAAQPMHL